MSGVVRRAGVVVRDVGGQDVVLRPGQAAVMLADDRVQRRLAEARPPEAASPVIVAAPARGPSRVVPQFETVLTESGPRVRAVTAVGFHPVACADAFDRMALRARGRGGEAPLFSVAQVQAGRGYAALTERVAAEGVRCASGEALAAARGGSGGGRDWIDGVIQRSARLAAMRAAIPVRVVLSPRGMLAHADRMQGQRTVRVRDVVEAVCIEGLVLADVLRRFGWTVATRYRRPVFDGLCEGLDSLYGL